MGSRVGSPPGTNVHLQTHLKYPVEDGKMNGDVTTLGIDSIADSSYNEKVFSYGKFS